MLHLPPAVMMAVVVVVHDGGSKGGDRFPRPPRLAGSSHIEGRAFSEATCTATIMEATLRLEHVVTHARTDQPVIKRDRSDEKPI
ncbi:hypothetical protein E2C01_015176 [Portunus trituberculatus]|uniref:Uncharacterized protein n=1 Tax=Portunus trituberculatus TaxID=210409 RepID=A0A5B7DM48_PORTR|nr:hypothetical protein [Portunus trituberculatus]